MGAAFIQRLEEKEEKEESRVTTDFVQVKQDYWSIYYIITLQNYNIIYFE